MIGVRNGGIGNRSTSPFYHFSVARCLLRTKLLNICSLIIIGLLIFYFLRGSSNTHMIHERNNNEELKLRSINNIEELKRIKNSISKELRELESKRNKLQDDITNFESQSAAAEKEAKQATLSLESIKRQILQKKNERLELLSQNSIIPPPIRLLPSSEDNIDMLPPKSCKRCGMYNSFDYSRCSLTSNFPVYVYPYENRDSQFLPIVPYIISATKSAFEGNPYVTSDPYIACIYVVLIGEIESEAVQDSIDSFALETWLSKLPYWRGDGRNHILIHLSRQTTNQNMLLGINAGRAMLAQSSFMRNQYRVGFDIILPSLISTEDKVREDSVEGKDYSRLHGIPLVPIIREYFLTFHGFWSKEEKENEFHTILVNKLKELDADKKRGVMFLRTSCPDEQDTKTTGFQSEWHLCGSTEARIALLKKSTFSMIIAPDDDEMISTTLLNTRLAESLYSGAVPVILGSHVSLPFHEFIDWTKAAIIWPKSRITELPFLLSNYPHSDIFGFRSQGRFLYDNYFSSEKSVVDAMLAVLRTRLNIPAMEAEVEISNVLPHRSYGFTKEISPGDAQSEFGIPPSEGKIDSPKFVNNFTSVTIDTSEYWNKFPGPFFLYPSTPFDRFVPSDAKFTGSSAGFRPIAEGRGGAGEEFQKALGGNVPQEQFTIIILTYERDDVMIQCLQRLKGLPHLNKAIVVWNSPNPPDDSLQWPDIGVDVVVIRPNKNSLNNRFLPYDEIETDAVLSIDDDAHLRHDEILFSFRVWREQRDSIVGFPGRFHAWDIEQSEWKYNSDYSCELSMVLTGAAFFHKYYMYLYTNWLPQEIRDKVDEYMNCEDIAMNFLVSHITRKPPVKVTSRWTFRCPGCPDALSQSQSHYDERHICINEFAKFFGYMPLLSTQFRTDSILFKTRLPSNKQKCFKFI